MKPERILLVLVWLLLGAGAALWWTGGARQLRTMGVWLWVAAFVVLCVPLLIWSVNALRRGKRR
jgi:hypothetical protein